MSEIKTNNKSKGIMIKHIDGDDGKERVFVIEANKGKPVVDRLGLVKVIGGKYKGMDKIAINILEDRFGVCA